MPVYLYGIQTTVLTNPLSYLDLLGKTLTINSFSAVSLLH
jgi:hypothetical protein